MYSRVSLTLYITWGFQTAMCRLRDTMTPVTMTMFPLPSTRLAVEETAENLAWHTRDPPLMEDTGAALTVHGACEKTGYCGISPHRNYCSRWQDTLTLPARSAAALAARRIGVWRVKAWTPGEEWGEACSAPNVSGMDALIGSLVNLLEVVRHSTDAMFPCLKSAPNNPTWPWHVQGQNWSMGTYLH